ncbi:unnamed protein product [Adineta ricciae]|uniref:Uncharacterized protein n=1 Tax=Adineta ricciae TaxID=249248 RepID=A0A814KI27_ADIRI|nr:unnamed protein product [Adineta ricciae]
MNGMHREKRQDSAQNTKPTDADAGTGVFEAAQNDASQAVLANSVAAQTPATSDGAAANGHLPPETNSVNSVINSDNTAASDVAVQPPPPVAPAIATVAAPSHIATSTHGANGHQLVVNSVVASTSAAAEPDVGTSPSAVIPPLPPLMNVAPLPVVDKTTGAHTVTSLLPAVLPFNNGLSVVESVSTPSGHIIASNSAIPPLALRIPAAPLGNAYDATTISIVASALDATERIRRLKDGFRTDMARISNLVHGSLPANDNLIVKHERALVMAFIMCCMWDEIMHKDLWQRYVASYSSRKTKAIIVNVCREKHSAQNLDKCTQSIKHADAMRGDIYRKLPEATRNLLFSKVQEALERFSNSMQPVFEYENATYPFCRSVLISIWDPEAILMCEEKYRLRLLNANDGGDSYANFQIISSRLFDVVATLLSAINLAWKNISDVQTTNKIPVSPEIINQDMEDMKDKLLAYTDVADKPLTRHLSVASAAYEECCAAMETDDLFNDYLTNINHNFELVLDDIYLCHKKLEEIHQSNPYLYLTCDFYYNQSQSTMKEREENLEKYKDQKETILHAFESAISPKRPQSAIIKAMGNMSRKYCNQHIFKLMYLPLQIWKCEKQIRDAIAQNGTEPYQRYEKSISKPFRDIVLQDWKNLERAEQSFTLSSSIEIVTSQPLKNLFHPVAIITQSPSVEPLFSNPDSTHVPVIAAASSHIFTTEHAHTKTPTPEATTEVACKDATESGDVIIQKAQHKHEIVSQQPVQPVSQQPAQPVSQQPVQPVSKKWTGKVTQWSEHQHEANGNAMLAHSSNETTKNR